MNKYDHIHSTTQVAQNVLDKLVDVHFAGMYSTESLLVPRQQPSLSQHHLQFIV